MTIQVTKITTSKDITDVGDPRYLKLDQTTPQTVENGLPVFDSGIKSNGPIILKAGQKLIFDGD